MKGGARPRAGRKPAMFDEKRAVTLRSQGMTYAQIAVRFGVSEWAITWFFRKKRREQQELDGKG